MARPRKKPPQRPEDTIPPENMPEDMDPEFQALVDRMMPKMIVDDPVVNEGKASHNNEDAPVPEIIDIVKDVQGDIQKMKFLIALAELGNRSRAARVAGVATATVWQWRRSDRKFRTAMDRAQEVANMLAEDELVRRATEGVVEPVFQGGHLVGGIRRLSDQLLMFYLKANMPEKYREKIDANVTVDVADRLIKARERAFGRLKSGDEE